MDPWQALAAVSTALTTVIAILWRLHLKTDEECRTERDFWRNLAMRGAELADKATTVAVRKRASDDE